MFHIDHIAIVARNIYPSTRLLSKETGFGNYDGGYRLDVPINNKIVPLGPTTYVEVIGLGDPYAVSEIVDKGSPLSSALLWMYDRGRAGDRLLGYCLRCDTMDELRAFAVHHKAEFALADQTKPAPGRINMDGSSVGAVSAPPATMAWVQGYPNAYVFSDMSRHPSLIPPLPNTGTVIPKGIAWLEVGGTQEDMDRWLGIYPAKDLPLRYNGKRPGLYAFAVKTDNGEVVVRRPSLYD